MKALEKIVEQYNSILLGGVIDYDKFNGYAIVHHSSAIEGSSLSQEETILLLNEQLTPKNKPLADVNMVLAHYKALQFVLDLAKKKEQLTLAHIQKISSLIVSYKYDDTPISVMAGNFYPSKGEFRKCAIIAGNHTFIAYEKVPLRVNALIDYVNNTIKKVQGLQAVNDLAFNTHFEMVTIHPFADGNGRISRLLMNYVQAYHNQPLSIVFTEDKEVYYKALMDARAQEDIAPFYKFMYTQYEKYIMNEIKLLTPKESKKNRGMSFLF